MSFSWYWIWISLLLLILCGVFFFFNKKPKFIVPLKRLQQRSRFFYNALLWLVLFCIIILPLNLSFVTDKHVVAEKNLPVQIILDVSLSMSANDIQPSRFVAAKEALLKLINQLDGYYISLIVFSWKPIVTIPFSDDSSAVTAKLKSMNLGDFPPVQDFLWTALGDSLLLGVANLQYFTHQETYKPWIVLLITDGDSNVWFDPLQVVSYCKKLGVPIFTLGVWENNYLIGRDTFDTDIITSINTPLLQQLADKTWWKFYRVFGDQTFDTFFTKTAQEIISQQQQHIQNKIFFLNDYLIYLLVCALLWLLWFRFISLLLIPHKK